MHKSVASLKAPQVDLLLEKVSQLSDEELLNQCLITSEKKVDVEAVKSFIIGAASDQTVGFSRPLLEKVCVLRELLKRCLKQQVAGKKPPSRKELVDYLIVSMQGLSIESMKVLFLDTQGAVIADKTMWAGTIDHITVYPREIVKACLIQNAAGIILCHNHPSGVPEPSRADCELTWKLKKVLALVNVVLHDHIIVGCSRYYSFSEYGQLSQEKNAAVSHFETVGLKNY